MDQIVALEQVDAVIVPFALLAQSLGHAVVHIRRHHHKALTIPTAGDIGIALTTLDTGMFLDIHHRTATQDILIMVTVTAQCKGRPLPTIAHVAIQIAIVAFLNILC